MIIEESHHAYSNDSYTCTVYELFEYLVEMAILLYIDLKRNVKLLTVAPLKMPCRPNVATLVTKSELGSALYKQTYIEQVMMRKEANDERKRREKRGEGDRCSKICWMITTEIENKLVQKKFGIKMRFIQPGDSGKNFLDWYHGTVTEIVNKKKRRVAL